MARRNVEFKQKNLSTTQATRKLHEIGEHVTKAAKSALKAGVYKVADDAKSRVPVRTGRLRDSIKVMSNRDGSSYKVSANAENNKGIRYGKIVEYSPKIQKPFLHPALDANRQQIRDSIETATREAIRRGH